MKPPLLFKIFGGGILYKISHKEILMRKMQGQDLLAGPLTVGSTSVKRKLLQVLHETSCEHLLKDLCKVSLGC